MMPESIDAGGGLFVRFSCTFLFIVVALSLRTLYVLQQIQTSRRQQSANAKKKNTSSTPTSKNYQNQNQQQHQQKSSNYPIKTMIVLGSGGHTTEMLRMTQFLDAQYYHPLVYVKASTDTTSLVRVVQQQQQRQQRHLRQVVQSSQSYFYNTMSNDTNRMSTKKTTAAAAAAAEALNSIVVIHDIPRSREVGQSYASSILSTLYAAWYAFRLVARERPGLILTNGPGTCVPLVLAALVGRILGFGYYNLPPWSSNTTTTTTTTTTRTVFVESYCRVQTLSLTGKVLFYIADVFLVHWPELQQQYPDKTVLVHTFNNNSNTTSSNRE
jgi:beta-1,4-N-acetylglucosaminyltransferase